MINVYAKDNILCDKNSIGTITQYNNDSADEERNGQHTHTMLVYHTDPMFNELVPGVRIKTDTSPQLKDQIYIIQDIKKTHTGKSEVHSVHVNYLMMDQQIRREIIVEKSSCKKALDKLIASTVDKTPFTAYSNITTVGSINLTVNEVENARQVMGGTRGGILDVYNGEYEFDNYEIRLMKNRGANRNVTIAYGKNLQTLEQDESIASTYTSVFPKATVRAKDRDEESFITLYNYVVDAPTVGLYPQRKVLTVDFSDKMPEGLPVGDYQDKLKKEAEKYIKDNNIGYPKVKLKVSYLDLSKTLEYKDYAVMEEVNLCDTVKIKFESLGIDTEAKVIKTSYSKRLGRYTSIELGEPKYTLSDKIKDIEKDIQKAKDEALSTDFIQEMIAHQTDLITGNKGGNMIIRYSSDGLPNELLFMDKENINQAREVLRINRTGIGFSSSGWQGPFDTAWTLDGAFNASFITTGVLQAITIKAVDIIGSKIVGSKIMTSEGGYRVEINGSDDTINTYYNGVLFNKLSGGGLSFYRTNGTLMGNIGRYQDVSTGFQSMSFVSERNSYISISSKRADGTAIRNFVLNGSTGVIDQGETHFKNSILKGANLDECSVGRYKKLTFHNNSVPDFYADIRMNGFEIRGQSDMRLKKNIKPTKVKGIKETKRLRVVDFEWDKSNPKAKNNPDGKQFGIIAQDTKLLSDINSDDHYLTVSMNKQVNLNTLTNKELIDICEKQDEQMKAINDRLSELEKTMLKLNQTEEEV